MAPLWPIPGESAFANAVFADYAFLGPKRRIRRLHERYGQQTLSRDSTFLHIAKVPTLHTMNKWSSSYCWKERAKAYDQAEETEMAASWEELRRQRQAQILEDEWETGSRLMELGMAILSQPDVFLIIRRRFIPAKRGTNGAMIPAREITTIRFDTASLFRLIKLVSMWQRRAAGLANRSGGDARDFRHLTDEQLREILHRNAERESQHEFDARPDSSRS